MCVCMHMREEADGEDPNSLYSKQEIYHSWHDEDAIVVPSSCAHVLKGEERVKTVMWGRWQLRNESSGHFRSLSLGPLSFFARFRRVPPLPCVHIVDATQKQERALTCKARSRENLKFFALGNTCTMDFNCSERGSNVGGCDGGKLGRLDV